jgi:asparagine synthase (glutamine-hydrolysing)
MRRLSIIHLHSGHQPISNEDGSVWVVFNGEIYNYRPLRPELIAKGHRFHTNSDTETLIHL